VGNSAGEVSTGLTETHHARIKRARKNIWEYPAARRGSEESEEEIRSIFRSKDSYGVD